MDDDVCKVQEAGRHHENSATFTASCLCCKCCSHYTAGHDSCQSLSDHWTQLDSACSAVMCHVDCGLHPTAVSRSLGLAQHLYSTQLKQLYEGVLMYNLS